MNFKIGETVKVNDKYYKYCNCDDSFVRSEEGNNPGLVSDMIYFIGKKIKISDYDRINNIYFSEETGLWWGDWQLNKISKLELE